MMRFVLIGLVALCSCHKSADSLVQLKSTPQASATGRFIILDATPSTGSIAKWSWQLDNSAGVTYPSADSILWYPKTTFNGTPSQAVNVTVPRAGKYIFGLRVEDGNGNWDYSVVTVNVQQ